ncbi:hypothetical protein EC973_008050 [Apophysomyces ossiformis]|uniref:Uncharacterized protein n=1 Tax=Apophysomyces ossiformis TaxID=679940 RepID=A0A8H7EQK1_9FUNG|nr:hypothetical protein EC973_008050 [Apophysomyces ossiformis]
MQDFDKYEVERAKSVVEAIPCMSKSIIDDTLYEKVLSFLTGFLAKDPHHITLFDNWGILEILNQACEQPDQDYRVVTVCFRLLGRMVASGAPKTSWIFLKLRTQYPILLSGISSMLLSYNAAVRFACLEACKNFTSCIEGAKWLVDNEQARKLISLALLDQSTFVVSEYCNLFCSLINHHALDDSLEPSHIELLEELSHLMDPTDRTKAIFLSDPYQSLLMNSLDFCWAIANSKTASALKYMTETRILSQLLGLLDKQERLVRQRVIEILSVIFEWVSDPLAVLVDDAANQNSGGPREAYEYMLVLVTKYIENPSRSDFVLTAVSLLECSFTLLHRFASKDSNEALSCCHLLLDMTRICAEYPLSHGTLDFEQEKDTLDCALLVVEINSLSSEQRVLKAALNLVLLSLYHIVDLTTTYDTHQGLSKSMNLMIQKLNEVNIDCRIVSILLETFEVLLGHEKLGVLVMQSSPLLVDALNTKLLDTEWQIRDATVEFPCCPTKVLFALDNRLPLLVFDHINDPEAYVRASVLHVLKDLMTNMEGWHFVQKNQLTQDIAKRLPRLLHDSEAFVRRATLDAIICLVTNRSCEGMAMEGKESTSQEAMNDVVIRTCRLLESLWYLHVHELEQRKRSKSQISSDPVEERAFFYVVEGDKWIIEAVRTLTTNIERLVRSEALRIVESILEGYAQDSQFKWGKRALEDGIDEDTKFLETLAAIDVERLRDTVNPEHLYQEAFDINPIMMTQSIEPEDPEKDDVNMLDCY